MPMQRTTRLEWKTLLGVGLFSAALMLPLYQLYSALAFHTLTLRGLRQVSYEAEPTWFFIGLGVWIVVLTVFGGLLILGLYIWRAERRNLHRRETRPPLDNAVRESIDRKS